LSRFTLLKGVSTDPLFPFVFWAQPDGEIINQPSITQRTVDSRIGITFYILKIVQEKFSWPLLERQP
jgi:hypothetical protein